MKINQTSLSDLKNRLWPEQFAYGLSVAPEKRQLIRKDLILLLDEMEKEEPNQNKSGETLGHGPGHGGNDNESQKAAGSLRVCLVFDQEPPSSIIRFNLTGSCAEKYGQNGRIFFAETALVPVDTKGEERTAVVDVEDLRTGLWDVSVTSSDFDNAELYHFRVPGIARLRAAASK
jgi:hypothetical protein